MDRNDEIKMIAEAEGLELIATQPTAGGLSCAVTGFTDIGQAKSLAARHGLDTLLLYRDDGERLWHRGCHADRGISISCEEFGRHYVQYDATELRELRLQALSDIESHSGDLDMLGRAAAFYGALLTEVLRLEPSDGRFVIGRPFDVRTIRTVTDYPLRFHSPAAGMEFAVGVA